jgi:transcriptional regulator with PAS, ATPase and Fis domain
MPLALQSKLLRVLQEREVEPLGSNKVEPVDVRVIAATSRDLAAMVTAGTFRADLYYRLNVLPIALPPLRARRDDIEALAEALLEDIARRSGLATRSLAADALEALAAHDWPGNIRELRNVLEQAVLMHDELLLHAAQLPALGSAATVAARSDGPKALPDQLADVERKAIAEALRATGGNRVAAAKLLKMSRAALYDRLARYPELVLDR